MLSWLGLFCLAVASLDGALSAPLPFVVLHGIGDACTNPGLQTFGKVLANLTSARGTCIEIGDGVVDSWTMRLDYQAEIVCEEVRKLPHLSGGFNMITLSQGGLIGRWAIQSCPDLPPVHTFVSLGGPHAGISSPPRCYTPFFCRMMDIFLKLGVYSSYVQNNIAPSGYLRLPNDMSGYLKGCLFLPFLNNEVKTSTNVDFKSRFTSIRRLVLVMFEDDTVLFPKQTAHFGSNPAEDFTTVLNFTETPLYQEDWIGLRALHQSGRLTLLSSPGEHLHISAAMLRDKIVPYLTEGGKGRSRGSIAPQGGGIGDKAGKGGEKGGREGRKGGVATLSWLGGLFKGEGKRTEGAGRETGDETKAGDEKEKAQESSRENAKRKGSVFSKGSWFGSKSGQPAQRADGETAGSVFLPRNFRFLLEVPSDSNLAGTGTGAGAGDDAGEQNHDADHDQDRTFDHGINQDQDHDHDHNDEHRRDPTKHDDDHHHHELEDGVPRRRQRRRGGLLSPDTWGGRREDSEGGDHYRNHGRHHRTQGWGEGGNHHHTRHAHHGFGRDEEHSEEHHHNHDHHHDHHHSHGADHDDDHEEHHDNDHHKQEHSGREFDHHHKGHHQHERHHENEEERDDHYHKNHHDHDDNHDHDHDHDHNDNVNHDDDDDDKDHHHHHLGFSPRYGRLRAHTGRHTHRYAHVLSRHAKGGSTRGQDEKIGGRGGQKGEEPQEQDELSIGGAVKGADEREKGGKGGIVEWEGGVSQEEKAPSVRSVLASVVEEQGGQDTASPYSVRIVA